MPAQARIPAVVRLCTAGKSIREIAETLHVTRQYAGMLVHQAKSMPENSKMPVPIDGRSGGTTEVSADAWARRTLNSTRSLCHAHGVDFDLTPQDVLPLPDVCPVLGTPISLGRADGFECDPALDRVVSFKGYTKDNVVVISARAKRLKGAANPRELVQLAKFYWPKYRALTESELKADQK